MNAADGSGKYFAAIVTAAGLFLAPAWCSAATYYVSQSTGNDSASGLAAAAQGTGGPWKTLARASANTYTPGDHILLKCGDTWNEELHPKGSGTPANPIAIGSYGEGKKPLIDRQDYRKDFSGIRLTDQAGYKIAGIEFANCMTGIYGEYAAGSPPKKFIQIEDCYFHDSLHYGRYENYPKKKIGLGICFFSFETKNKIVLQDVTIKNCIFRRLASAIWTNSPDNFNKNASFIYNFANFTIEDCLFEEGLQWQQGFRGVDGGIMRRCLTLDIGRNFRAFNGVAGAMFFRCKNWLFEDCEWGCIDIGKGSGDGEAFDFEGNCDHITMRNCLFHDTDGPGFLLCCYASDGNPNKDIHMENCVLDGKAKRPIRLPRCEIVNTTDWNEVLWKNCRFYLSKGEVLMRTMDPEKDKRASFVRCVLRDLDAAGGGRGLPAKATASPGAVGGDAAEAAWFQLDFGKPTAVNEFKIKEAPSSAVGRYAIECWDDKASKWVSCFNGLSIGAESVAPIVGRTTRKARLVILATKGGKPGILEFAAYDDTRGEAVNVARGNMPTARAGK